QLHDFYESSTFLFIIFELAKGGELFDYLTRHVTLSEKKIRHIMRQIFEAVAAIHAKNIVHRDLKPENILLVGEDVVKVTDFGFAYELKEGERLKELVGTPGYLAPEVLKVNMYETADGYSKEVDLWACGVIMYTLFCGYAPFYHKKQLYMLRAISEGKYEFRSPEWDEITDVAKDLIRKLLVVDCKQRFTAKQALSHPFFQQPLSIEEFQLAANKFDARKRFRLSIIRVRLLVRLLRIKYLPSLIPARQVRNNPYAARKIRKQIDNLAFHVYGHWVKKGREQYRDALFANSVRSESSLIESPKNANINKHLLTAIENRYNDVANALNEKKFSVYENEMILPQSKILPPDGKTYCGRADIVKYMEEYFVSRGKFFLKVEEVNGDGDWAYSRGTYKFTDGNTDKEVG
uniref:phosphorylase kinase n=1 Tax=Romanomermis culicivorax TaxID=13658 RepID=A0A915L8J8_ROMCU